MTDNLFNPEAFEQMPGQISMEQCEPTFKLWRYSHRVGRDNNKFHVVESGAETALCGRSRREFNAVLADGYEQVIFDAEMVCSRCEAKR